MDTNLFEFKISGKRALFSNPLTRIGGEKSSYPIPTYEALKGITKGIYWKPSFIWYVDAVRVMNPIKMEAMATRVPVYNGGFDLFTYLYLQDVEYQVRAHYEWNMKRPEMKDDRDSRKHSIIFRRSLKMGGRLPLFLGTSECTAFAEPCVFGEGNGAYDNSPETYFGIMVHSTEYPDENGNGGHVMQDFWHPVMKNGIITFPKPEECTIKKDIGKIPVKVFEKKE